MSDVSKEIKMDLDLTEVAENDNWKIEIQGDSGAIPEMRVPQPEVFYGHSASLNYYPVDRFQVTNKKTGKVLNVLAVTPDNWSHKMIMAADEEDIQAVSDLGTFIYYDEAHGESSWGKGVIANPPVGYGGLERMPKHIMFNVLHTLALEDLGSAVTLPGEASAHKEIDKKVDELMKIWNNPEDKRSIDELVKNAWKNG